MSECCQCVYLKSELLLPVNYLTGFHDYVCYVHRLDEWVKLHIPLCRGGRDKPNPLWAGVHRGYQPAHADPRDPKSSRRQATGIFSIWAASACAHNYAGARKDCSSRWGWLTLLMLWRIYLSLKHILWLKILSWTSACDLTSSAGDDSDPLFSHPRDLDLIQSVPTVDLLSMKAPPRVLTLTEQPLDSLETDQTPPSQSHPSQAVCLILNSYLTVILLTVHLLFYAVNNFEKQLHTARQTKSNCYSCIFKSVFPHLGDAKANKIMVASRCQFQVSLE